MKKQALELITDSLVLENIIKSASDQRTKFIESINLLWRVAETITLCQKLSVIRDHHSFLKFYNQIQHIIQIYDSIEISPHECNDEFDYFLNEYYTNENYDEIRLFSIAAESKVKEYNDEILMIELLFNIMLIYNNLERAVEISDLGCYLEDFLSFLQLVERDFNKYMYVFSSLEE